MNQLEPVVLSHFFDINNEDCIFNVKIRSRYGNKKLI